MGAIAGLTSRWQQRIVTGGGREEKHGAECLD